ncbi:GNAT family N-acetyltransferase [Tyzzerella sp. OttesenSCG-928-J15]|nr:GNAT family N-acetyltransferase [Tyzzerella sp. OttesenSCG-928-J15]
MALMLIVPERKHEAAWNDILSEYRLNNAKVRWDMHMGFESGEYERYLQMDEDFRNSVNIAEGYSGRTSYFMVDSDRPDYFIGSVSVRYELTSELINIGGHIGYSIRPNERGKGYGTKQLQLALDVCRKLGIENALLTCNNTNMASAAVIKKCGGVFESSFTEDNSNIVDRYWIKL